MPEPAILFRDVDKSFGRLHVLQKLSFEVGRGEMFGLLGPNGCGKTTSIKILLGLDAADAGRVEALGAHPRVRATGARIGYMPQETALYTDLTLAENIALYGALYGMKPAAIRASGARLVKFVDLDGRENDVLGTFSGGMRHRASLIVALLHSPELLVLDEPTVGVDPELRAGFWGYFADLRKTGVTILLTTHYLDEAKNCSRVGFMREGNLIAQGTVAEVLAAAGTDDLEKAFLHFSTRRTEASA
ncbi:MAG: ABC transporter ATP-binding protein [Thermoplasmatota archaeon]